MQKCAWLTLISWKRKRKIITIQFTTRIHRTDSFFLNFFLQRIRFSTGCQTLFEVHPQCKHQWPNYINSIERERWRTWYSWKYTNPVQMEKKVQTIWNIGTMRIASKSANPSFNLVICIRRKWDRIRWSVHCYLHHIANKRKQIDLYYLTQNPAVLRNKRSME